MRREPCVRKGKQATKWERRDSSRQAKQASSEPIYERRMEFAFARNDVDQWSLSSL